MQKPTLILKDPKLIKKITITDFGSFYNHDDNYDVTLDKLLGKSLVFLRDLEWKNMRTLLSPVFTSSKLKYMYELLVECQEDFMKILEQKAEANDGKIEIDTYDTFARLTADGISTTTLGIKGDCVKNKNSKLYEISESMSKDLASLSTTIYFTMPKVFKFLNLRTFRKSTHTFFETYISDEMRRREKENVSRPDAIQLMMKLRKGEQLKMETGDSQDFERSELKNKRLENLTDEDFAAQAMGFFLAGFDAKTSFMQAMCFELAINPDVQQTLIQEVDEMLKELKGAKISYDQISSMKFLKMVTKETLRKWPPTRLTTRVCAKDYLLIDDETGKTYEIKKGTNIFISILDIQMDPKYFKDPEKFNPYRFSPENSNKINDGAYIPFGVGPRHCLGDRFAMLEAKLIWFYILSRFAIEPTGKTPSQLELPQKTTGYEQKIQVVFKLRKKCNTTA